MSNMDSLRLWWDNLPEAAQDDVFRKLKCKDRRSLCKTNKVVNETFCKTDWHISDCKRAEFEAYSSKISGIVKNLAEAARRLRMQEDATVTFHYSFPISTWKVNMWIKIDMANGNAVARRIGLGYYSIGTINYFVWVSDDAASAALPPGLLDELSEHMPKLYGMLSMNTFEHFDALPHKEIVESITPSMKDMGVILRNFRNVDPDVSLTRLKAYAVMYYYRDVIAEAFAKAAVEGIGNRPSFTMDMFNTSVNSKRIDAFNALFSM